MALHWTRSAQADLARFHEFLEPVDRVAAATAVRSIVARVRRIPAEPSLGLILKPYAPREVRHVFIGRYEIRYEIRAADICILRVFDAREDR